MAARGKVLLMDSASIEPGSEALCLSQCDGAVLAALRKHGVRAIVIGGRAVHFYGAREVADDLDLFVDCPAGTVNPLAAALVELGCNVSRYPASAFGEPGKQIPIKHYDFNVDLLTTIPGLEFEMAWARAALSEVGGATVRILSRDDLVQSKRIAGRAIDLEDVRVLERGSTER